VHASPGLHVRVIAQLRLPNICQLGVLPEEKKQSSSVISNNSVGCKSQPFRLQASGMTDLGQDAQVHAKMRSNDVRIQHEIL
jgi:hypothetical protein